MTLNILGTEYKVKMNVNYAEDKDLKGRMGYCGLAIKEIVVADIKTIESWENETDEAIQMLKIYKTFKEANCI